MRRTSINLRRVDVKLNVWLAVVICGMFLVCRVASAQVDQGTITGVVDDTSNAAIPGARVTLTDTDTGLALQSNANGSGIYVFSPVKIGNYKLTATAPGFATTDRGNLHLDLQERLNVVLVLKTGSVSETVTVNSEVPLLQTQEGSVGQVIDSKTLNDTPLNGRNWVFIAQLTAGVDPTFGGTRGSGTGDFIANGQSGEQNNFILDGVDNNSNLVDFLNGASYIIRPPPDALAQFKIQTSNYSAEFGHSAGAVVNASVKSGTNQIHGGLWEYVRNTDLDAKNWNALTNPPYHENQFGAALGFPIFKNRLFYFGDTEANRISIAQVNTLSVPTPLERTGDFSELLNKSLTGNANPIYLYVPNSGGNTDKTGQSTVNRQSCNGVANVLCPNQIDPIALKILNLYPAPAGPNAGLTYNNLVENVSQENNIYQWDQRLDYDFSQKDQAFVRFSYSHGLVDSQLPLGPTLDGSGYGGYKQSSLAENFVFSETHIFVPSLVNEVRFGYNWGYFSYLQPNANVDLAAQLGFGNVPYSPGNGGLPTTSVGGITRFGTVGFEPGEESQNVYQIQDNITKVIGNHSLKAGVQLENLRFFYSQSASERGAYNYTGTYTSSPATSISTGSGIADFLVNQMHTASITNALDINDQESYNSAYLQDDWRATPRLTLNLGVRYDFYQPYKEMSGSQSNFVVNGPLGIGFGSAVYQITAKSQQIHPVSPAFVNLLSANNVSIQYVNRDRLLNPQYLNFAPRLGFAYQLDSKTVINGGTGIFYGGLQSEGNGNLGSNYPFTVSDSIPAPSCSAGNCPSIGITIENGLESLIAGGLQNSASFPGFHATDLNPKTPYTMDYNLSFQSAFSNSLVATISYVGNLSRHIELYHAPNTAPIILPAGKSATAYLPFPGLGGTGQISYSGVGTYNSLQTKLEKQYANGLSFLATYTWAHALDDSSDAGGLQSGIGQRQRALFPDIAEFTNSAFDVRHRVTVNGNYALPFGRERAFLSHDSRLTDIALGGWSMSLTFIDQTGIPFTVTPNVGGPSNGSARAIPMRNPFAPGGSPDPSNPNAICASSTRNKINWYNPCAFANPLPGNLVPAAGITTAAGTLPFLGGVSNFIYGPGYNRANVSLFKNFATWEKQYLQFRADAFNIYNNPSYGNPSTTNDNSNGGVITTTKNLQNNTPDARFFQLSAKYVF